MGKHHVKNGPPPPKNGPPPPPRSDPSNEEYITVPKKVTFDSLVEFSPHELNSCRHRSLLTVALLTVGTVLYIDEDEILLY